MTVTLSDQPAWPDGDPGRVLLNCIISTDVDEVFEELFGSYPRTQAKLHKQRNDSNCAESPWVSQRSQLPAQQFVWPAPPAGADPGTAAQGSWRKVRFDAPPSMASKAFSSEEVQRVLLLQPSSHYQLDTEVYTTAMYGDQFTVLSRYTLAARGAGKTHLHVLYAIAFKPSLSRLMKPMVAKGVDGGIRGSFGVLKKLLQEQYGLSDLPDSVPAATLPGAGAAAAAAAATQAAPEAAAAAALPAAPVAAAPAPGLLALADYVVYQDLVASIVKVSDPQLVAKALAMCLTLVLIHMLLVLLRPISQACACAGAAAAAGASAGLMSWLCWPVAVGLDIPDSLGEVLGALLLVAVANKVLLVGVEVVAAAMHGGSSPSVAASRQASVLGAALSAVAAAASSGPSAAAAANGHHPADARSQPAAPAAAAAPDALASGDAAAAAQQLLSPRRSAPMPVPSKTANGSAGGGSTGTGSGGGVEAALASFSTAMTGWGRNLLGAGGGVDAFANNQGIKALVSGSWSRSSGETGKTNDAGQGPGGASTAAAAADGKGGSRLSSAGSGPGRAPSHRPSSSFSGFMDPSGLNIIEDYALQANDSGLPQLPEEQSTAGSSPAASEGGPFTAAAAGRAAAAAAAERQAIGTAAGGIRSNSPAHSGSPGKGAGRSSSPSKMKRAGSSKKSLSEAEADAEARQPLLSSAASRDGSLDLSSSQAGSTPHKQGPGQGTSRPTTPVPGDDVSTPPLLASSSPLVSSATRQQQQQQQQVMRSSKSVSFSQSPEAADTSSSGHGPLLGSHSAAAILAGASGLAKSAGGVAGSPGGRLHSTSPLACRSASPLLYGASPPPEPGLGLRRASSSYEPLPVSSGSGYVVPVEPGQEDEDEVLVEVFEHERVQPFRGWGHTWPGHFLPSDKVGHWGDITGAPGGATSMLFDRVAPKLPAGWTWQDQEWTVDMTGAEQEGCDAEGWAYGMDFSWLTWPPAPQSGKPGIKSFVRRRRWVRMRARLPPGAAEDAGSQQEGAAQEEELQHEPVFVLRGGEGQQAVGPDSGPLGSRDSLSNSASDGGFMAGLGLGSGLGMVSHDSASAAAAAAGAMVSRFMKAVQDLPLAPRGSSTGSGDGLRTSPPPGPESGPAAAAGVQASMDDESSISAEAPAVAAGTAGPSGSSSSSGDEAGADQQAAGVTAAEAPTSVAGTKQQQQQQQGPTVSSNGGGSFREGGDSRAVSDSDSSSVDSDSPPPRPRLSEVMAGLHTGDDVPAVSQPHIEHGAAGVDAVGSGAAGAVDSIPAAAAATVAAATVGSTAAAAAAAAAGRGGKAATKDPAGMQAGGVAIASPALHVAEVPGAAADLGAVPEAAAGASTAPTVVSAAAGDDDGGAGAGAAAAEALPEGSPSPAAVSVSSATPLAAAVPGDDQPQEGLPAAAAQAATPAVSCAVEQEQQMSAAAAPGEHLGSAAHTRQAAVASVSEASAAGAGPAASEAAGESTCADAAGKPVPAEAYTRTAAGMSSAADSSAAGGSPGEAAAAPVAVTAGAAPGSNGSTSSSPPGDSVSTPQPEGVPAAGLGPHHAAGAGMLRSIPSPGSGQGALGSGDWVWSTAAAESEAAAGSLNSPGAASRVQQSGLEEGGLSEDLPTSPVAAGTTPAHQQQQQQGVGGVTRSGSGAGGRGVVRTGSGARGSRGRQSKLGAVPLRRSGEGASAGGAHSSSSGGTTAGLAGSGGIGAAEALAAAAAATVAVPAQAVNSSGSSGAEVTRGPGGTQTSETEAAPGVAAGGVAAPASVSRIQDAAAAQQVSGDDMGSGLGWASPPDRHMPASAAAVHRARGHQQQQRVAGPGQHDDGKQDRKDW